MSSQDKKALANNHMTQSSASKAMVKVLAYTMIPSTSQYAKFNIIQHGKFNKLLAYLPVTFPEASCQF